MKVSIIMVAFLCLPMALYGQVETRTYGKGIVFSADDGSFEVKLGTRFQTLYAGTQNLENNEFEDRMLIRRSRLKFDGFVYDPKIVFKIELALSNNDTRNSSSSGIPQNSGTSNIVLDAVVKYKFAPNWEVWFGQTKLPGNRERVISSQKLQFVDRSLVNSRFNIDRDMGVHVLHKTSLGDMVMKEHISISMGEGRNITSSNAGGYDYTARVELLPFGEFTSKGDYFGSDLSREKNHKLSVGATLDFNDGASRSRGQLGSFVYDANNDLVNNNLTSVFVDAMYKYRGFSVASEYANKKGETGIAGFGTGTGFVAQAGYLYNSNIETSFRYTVIDPDNALSALDQQTQYTFGLSKYVVGHNLKIQSDISYSDFEGADNEMLYRFQVEVAF